MTPSTKSVGVPRTTRLASPLATSALSGDMDGMIAGGGSRRVVLLGCRPRRYGSRRRRHGDAMNEMDAITGTPAGSRFAGRTAWARSLQTPLRAFLQTETGGAAVLLAAAAAALLWVN